MTPKRMAILEAVRSRGTHPPADEIYRVVKEALPSVSLSTVYRNLERLADRGLIQKVEVGHGPTRYCGNPKPHDHLHCTACGEVVNAPTLAFDAPMAEVEAQTGWKFRTRRMLLEGLCPACREAAGE